MTFILLNMNWSGMAAVALNERLKTKFVCLLTEPYHYKGKLASIPAKMTVIPENITDPRASIFF